MSMQAKLKELESNLVEERAAHSRAKAQIASLEANLIASEQVEDGLRTELKDVAKQVSTLVGIAAVDSLRAGLADLQQRVERTDVSKATCRPTTAPEQRMPDQQKLRDQLGLVGNLKRRIESRPRSASSGIVSGNSVTSERDRERIATLESSLTAAVAENQRLAETLSDLEAALARDESIFAERERAREQLVCDKKAMEQDLRNAKLMIAELKGERPAPTTPAAIIAAASKSSMPFAEAFEDADSVQITDDDEFPTLRPSSAPMGGGSAFSLDVSDTSGDATGADVTAENRRLQDELQKLSNEKMSLEDETQRLTRRFYSEQQKSKRELSDLEFSIKMKQELIR